MELMMLKKFLLEIALAVAEVAKVFSHDVLTLEETS